MTNSDEERIVHMSGGDGSKVATLVPTKSDQDYAQELKQRLLKAYEPVLEILTEAKRNNFEINVTTGANGFNIVQVANIQVLKVY